MGSFGAALGQAEIGSPRDALDELGRPVNFGWARRPLWNYDPLLLRSPARRVSASDRYLIQMPGCIMTLQVSDSGITGYVGITIISLKDKTRSSQTYTIPFPLGAMELPGSSETGRVRIQTKHYLLDFSAMEGGARIIRADFPKFGRHRFLRGELVLNPPPEAESLVTHMPWRRGKNAFALLRRSPCYAVEGIMQFGGQELLFPQGKSWGLYEWRREVRPPSDLHFWAGASGASGGVNMGFTVGYGNADAGAGTENAVFVEGKIHKLDQVTFHISTDGWAKPWRFTSNDGRLEMTFSPCQERIERKTMFFHSIYRRQLFGSFAGRVILDDGKALEFSDLFGMTERSKSVN
ncbi:MAG: DUF2804 domain-containing protein [Spirochaetaceae bacterium]|jgi:hypothetical protein|nr:DUF2804 domain-containing protein [Spirochaetaceae bacterium]